MKISVCQINPIIADFKHNTSLILEAAAKSRESDCSLAVFPELSIMGYPPKDLLEKPAFIAENLRRLDMLASGIEDIHILCGFVDKNPGKTGNPLINSVALIGNGKIIDKKGKRLLPTYDVFDETRYFEPAEESLVFDLEGKRFGVTICEDIWNVGDIEGVPRYSIDPVRDIKDQGTDIHINLSASPYSINKGALRQEILGKLSMLYDVPTVFCNQVGGNDDLLFDGSSMVVDHRGRLIVKAKEFESDMVIWDTDKDYRKITNTWSSEEESVLKGLIMGTRDYVYKCGFKRVLVGLSGGIDSTLVAVIAQRAMGPENVMGVSMPSPYTSKLSRRLARTLAKNLKIPFKEIPIIDIFQSYKKSLAPCFEGLKEDVTEENIQARIRGNLLMALSNKFNSLLLTTGNKSETATGYCTLYGDMSGGLAVISDTPKTLCYRLANYINRDDEIIPEEIISRPPSAELKPGQTDQDTLPPYDVLDNIVEAVVEKNLSHEEIMALGYEPGMVKDILRRIVNNEYKRRQASPGLKITSKAFGYGRRYPIARGGDAY
ncbi:NAD+ synthase [Thermodesulfobacteriota bacterium]